MMDRRRLLLTSLAATVGAPLGAGAQQVARVYRIGWLASTVTEPVSEAFAKGMRERGWVEGQNFTVERRYTEGHNERYPRLAAELVQARPDLVITAGTGATAAVKAATSTIPIVFYQVGDPVFSGLVASLARPGGNVTGMGGQGPGTHGKSLELIKEAVPKASLVGLIVNSGFPLHTAYRKEIESVARTLNVTLRSFDVQVPEELDRAFAASIREQVDALLLLGQPLMRTHRARVAKLALEHKMPAIVPFSDAVEAGVLMSYGDRQVDQARRLPYYIDRILKGTKPADIPVEQSTMLYLWINMKTAKALGLTIPPSLLARADQVLE